MFEHASENEYKLSTANEITITSELVKRSAPVVRLPNVEKDFILEKDASHTAVGAVLDQFFADTELEYPVGFGSCALSKSDRNYEAYELKELSDGSIRNEHQRDNENEIVNMSSRVPVVSAASESSNCLIVRPDSRLQVESNEKSPQPRAMVARFRNRRGEVARILNRKQ